MVSGCDDNGSAASEPELVAEGQALYEAPIEGGNTFACSTCHAMNEGEGLRRAGHALGGATRRGFYKNGQLDAFEDAVNSCLVEWMNAEPWSEDDRRMQALSAFVDAGSGAEADVVFEIVQPPAGLDGGDADAGRDVFNASCAECHGTDGVGTQRAISVANGTLDPAYVARRVRTSGVPSSPIYDNLTGGIMPFWAKDRLSDGELLDIVAYLSRDWDPDAPPPEPPDEPDEPDDPDEPTPPSGCGSSHPKVGQTAVLQEFFHDVGGIAEIVDDCTIEIRDFTFDGQGIDAQIYGGFEGMYDDGFSMSENLVRAQPYDGEVLTLTLPEGRSLDDLGGVSVWCVPVGANFGSGSFE
jgi:cytochrome c